MRFDNPELDRLLREAQLLIGEGSYDQSTGYHGHPSAPYSAELETQIFLYGLIRRMRPKKVIETGTNEALTTVFLAQGILDADRGHLWTIELHDHWLVNARKHVADAGLESVVTFLPGSSIDEKLLLPDPPYDLVFLDSDHNQPHILAEFHRFAPHMSPWGWIFIHDSRCHGALGGVREACDVLRERADFSHVLFPSARGLDGFQKKGDTRA